MGELEARASDADRERVVDLLREHAGAGRLDIEELSERIDRAYAARTAVELRELVGDLAVPSRRKPARWTAAVMGEATREGIWRVPRKTSVLVLMGSARVDLRRAVLEEAETTITVWLSMGEATLVVPEEAEVELTGFVLMGGKRLVEPHEPPSPGAPFIRVRAMGSLGDVKVIRQARQLAD
jgi:hypothetical protein